MANQSWAALNAGMQMVLAALALGVATPAFAAHNSLGHSASLRPLDLEPALVSAPTSGSTYAAPPPATTADLRLGAAVRIDWETPSAVTLTRNFNRQGLPILRLWENSQASVALGLNRRGVLGMYLVQKTH